MKPKRRILSLLLVICLVVGLMPTVVFGAGTEHRKGYPAGGWRNCRKYRRQTGR